MSTGWKGSDRRKRLPPGWAKIRAAILERDPICKICNLRPSTHCDHIKPKTDDDRPSQLQGLCGPCHDHKSSHEGGQARAAKPGRKRPAEKHPGLL